MQPCPDCQALVESWEVFCHGCGLVISLDPVPVISSKLEAGEQMEQAFQDWFTRGNEALASQDFETAAVSYQEALRRTAALPQSREAEMKVRTALAAALEGSSKLAEAAEQYQAIAQRSDDFKEREEMELRASGLQEAAVVDSYTPVDTDYKAAAAFEIKVLPLYCASCKRLMSAAELYGFRKGLVKESRCLCGFAGTPLVKRTCEQIKIAQEEQDRQARKERLIKVASLAIQHGRSKRVATVLAFTLGWLGVHKFYLGEYASGALSLLVFWTGVPLVFALIEGSQLATMSYISFNLQYNTDLLLKLLPAEPVPDVQSGDDIFSMKVTADPEDFVDDLTGQEAAGS